MRKKIHVRDDGEYEEAIKLLKSGKLFEKPTGWTIRAHGVDNSFTDLTNERLNG
ncbi:hypothetical protein PtrEW7m1_004307 [Pyrenophora tritici-repentis]|nr:hypothetical protein PtrEW7m1_004307 [Pyrenophora tritici-repentis]